MIKDFDSQRQSIIEIISKGDIGKALEKLKEFSNSKKATSQIASFFGRYNEIKEIELSRTEPYEKLDILKNRLRKDILSYLDSKNFRNKRTVNWHKRSMFELRVIDINFFSSILIFTALTVLLSQYDHIFQNKLVLSYSSSVIYFIFAFMLSVFYCAVIFGYFQIANLNKLEGRKIEAIIYFIFVTVFLIILSYAKYRLLSYLELMTYFFTIAILIIISYLYFNLVIKEKSKIEREKFSSQLPTSIFSLIIMNLILYIFEHPLSVYFIDNAENWITSIF